MTPRSLVPLLLLVASLASAATLVPVAPAVLGPDATGALNVGIASSGGISLAVWASGTGYVYGSRFDASGRLLDAAPVLLDTTPSGSSITVVATNGGFLAAWGGEVRFIGLDGSLGELRNYGFADGSVAVSGDRALFVGWGSASSDASALLLDTRGNLVSQSPIPLPLSVPGRVFSDPLGFVFVSLYNAHVSVQRIDRNGTTMPVRPVAAEAAASAAGTFDGTNDVIVLAETDGIHSVTLDPLTLTPHLHGVIASGFQASISSDGTSTWLEVTSVALSAMPLQDGIPSGAPIDLGRGFSPAITLLNGAPVAAWFGPQAYVLQIGAGRPAILLSQAPALRQNARVANNGTTRVAVWNETVGPPTLGDKATVYVAAGALAADNTPVPGSGTILSHRDQPAGAPAIAAGDGDFLVVWKEATTLVGRRITSDLLFEDSEPFVIDGGVAALPAPRIAFDGKEWCVVYAGSEASGGVSLRAKRITTEGTVVDAQPIVLEPAPLFATKVIDFDVTWNGTDFVAVWHWRYWYGGHSPVTSAMRVGIVSPFGTSVRELEHPSRYTPRIAAGPHSMLIAAQRPADGFITGTFLRPDFGVTLIGVPRTRRRGVTPPERDVILDPSEQYAFSLFWNGARYELLYQPPRSYGFEGSGLPILRATVDESGDDLQTSPLAVAPVDAILTDAADESTIVVTRTSVLQPDLDWLLP